MEQNCPMQITLYLNSGVGQSNVVVGLNWPREAHVLFIQCNTNAIMQKGQQGMTLDWMRRMENGWKKEIKMYCCKIPTLSDRRKLNSWWSGVLFLRGVAKLKACFCSTCSLQPREAKPQATECHFSSHHSWIAWLIIYKHGSRRYLNCDMSTVLW